MVLFRLPSWGKLPNQTGFEGNFFYVTAAGFWLDESSIDVDGCSASGL